MNVPEHIIAQLEAIKHGTLSKAEALAKLDDSISEAQLEEYLALYEESLSAIDFGAVQNELKSIHQELYSEQSEGEQAEPQSKPNYRIWMMAASVVLIGAFTYLITQSGNRAKTFDDVFEPYTNLLSVRGEEEDDMTKAMRLYSSGQYQAAFEMFNQFDPDTLFNEYHFYKGITSLAIDSFDLARQSFNSIGIDTSNPYWQQTKWYLALAYWQLEQTQKAAELIGTISEDEFEYDQGQELLEQFPD